MVQRKVPDPPFKGECMENDGKFVKGMFCGVILALVCLGASLGWQRWKLSKYLGKSSAQSGTVQVEEQLDLDGKAVRAKLEEIQQLVNDYYLGEVDGAAIEEGIYEGMLEELGDPYSVYYSKEALDAMEEATNGVYSGIGAVMTQDPQTGEIYVVRCFDGTPSAEAGLLAGDVVTAVDGEALGNMDLSELVSRIKTGEGDSVVLTLQRDGETLEKELERRAIEVPTVEGEMLGNQIGYIRILEFDSVTTEQFQTQLESLEAEGMEKLIVDVRDNPGGVLQVACEVLDTLLPEGLIVYTEDKYGERKEYFSDDEDQFDKPLVVLINENSASASEIFAGAVKDYQMGTLVGTTTFGKGIVQRIYSLSDGSGIKLTIAKYYTPNGNDIHEIGIEPDVEVELAADAQTDNQLEEAIKIIENTNNSND